MLLTRGGSWLRGPLAVLDEPLVDYRVYPAKSTVEMSEALLPGADVVHWRKLRMWRAMWRATAADDVTASVRRVARREARHRAHRPGLGSQHISADALLLATSVRSRLRTRKGSP